MPHQQLKKKQEQEHRNIHQQHTHIQDTHNTFHSSSKWNTIPERVLTDQRAADFLSKQFNITKLIAQTKVSFQQDSENLCLPPYRNMIYCSHPPLKIGPTCKPDAG